MFGFFLSYNCTLFSVYQLSQQPVTSFIACVSEILTSLTRYLIIGLSQWFPTRMLRHIRLPWGGARGAAKYWKKKHITACNNWLFISALLLGVPKIVILGMVGCRQTFFSPKGCLWVKVEKRRLEPIFHVAPKHFTPFKSDQKYSYLTMFQPKYLLHTATFFCFNLTQKSMRSLNSLC